MIDMSKAGMFKLGDRSVKRMGYRPCSWQDPACWGAER